MIKLYRRVQILLLGVNFFNIYYSCSHYTAYYDRDPQPSKKSLKGRERKILPFVRIPFGLDAVLQKSRLLQKAIKVRKAKF
jgi:hypothetical protein